MPSDERYDSEQRRRMIAEAAYYRAERRGFSGGDAVRDWCEAEAEIDARLRRVEQAEYAAKIEEALEVAGARLASMRRKATRLSADLRAQWQKDVDRLTALRDALKPTVAELKERGEQASSKLREQAERLRGEIVTVVRQLEARAKH